MQLISTEQTVTTNTEHEGFYVNEDTEDITLKNDDMERVRGWHGRRYSDLAMAEKHAKYLRERCKW